MSDYAGRYSIVALLGEGAHATVYRARDRALDEDVALKVLRPHVVSTPILVEHFRREVRLSRRITHSNVARVFDIGEHDGERFLTMEFVDGAPLSDLLVKSRQQNRPLALGPVVAIARQVCAGLTAAHAAGVLHRDLKPANILLTRDQRVVITDFGIARPLRPEAGAAQTVGIWGSPAYMAPEQFNTPQEVDERADLYALGGVLFELLTGKLPFTGDSWIDVAMMRVITPPPDPRTLRPDLPEPAAQLILRCLARKPEERYRSADEVAAALSPLLREGGRPVAADQPAGDGRAEPELTQIIEVQRLSVPTPAPNERPAPRVKTLAVLPLQHEGAQSEPYLADGLTELFREQLGAVRGLRVRSRGAVMALRGDRREIRALGQELGVQVVLSGELHVEDGTAALSLRLNTVGNGLEFWSRSIRVPLATLLQACVELVQAIAHVLTVAPPTEPALLRESPLADLYLRGRHLYHRGNPASLNESIALFEQALRSQPSDPLLLTAYAMACARQWFYGEARAGELANLAAARAVALAPRRAESHLAMAMVYFQFAELPRAAYELRCALAHDPYLAEARELTGRVLIETGPLPEGIQQLEFALRQDPTLRRVHGDLARASALLGSWEPATRLLSVEAASDAAGSTVLWTGLWTGRARLALWRRDTRAAQQDLASPLFQRSASPLAHRYLEAAMGARLDPATVLEPLRLDAQASPRGRSFHYQVRTELYALYGDVERALESLARAIAEGLYDLMWMERCPLLDTVRKDARYELMKIIVAHRANAVHTALGWAST